MTEPQVPKSSLRPIQLMITLAALLISSVAAPRAADSSFSLSHQPRSPAPHFPLAEQRRGEKGLGRCGGLCGHLALRGGMDAGASREFAMSLAEKKCQNSTEATGEGEAKEGDAPSAREDGGERRMRDAMDTDEATSGQWCGKRIR